MFITTADILSLLAAGIALLALLALMQLRRRLAQMQLVMEQQTQTLLAIQGGVKVLSGEAVTHREDLAGVRRAVERLGELNQQTRMEMRLRDADGSPYTQAIQLIRHGQPRAEVRKLCSLTESEVDLLFNLHGQGIALGQNNGQDD
ncbi:DUF2802 domain-containing protein [Thiorhodovibrio frisius]|uniref:DUF2802 domain-containing protein n=1 Tax=Thiorhodovibrio frisius TaxID=631362 RepID=H8YZN3_9GAMM|nr:DUF2802 domain-containing protein [Thiorhodovibrio frisius]EIC22160.1 Protein of unknown function (DUF2802) [Thiorhodovibrio frisius]WPL24454.1 hypothetical protein Thiofri_04674 [Thiorhodovibrio frisius]